MAKGRSIFPISSLPRPIRVNASKHRFATGKDILQINVANGMINGHTTLKQTALQDAEVSSASDQSDKDNSVEWVDAGSAGERD